MSWWRGVLSRLNPAPLPPLPPHERLNDERHSANRRLADAWQARLERRVDELDALVGDLAIELELHELTEHRRPGAG